MSNNIIERFIDDTPCKTCIHDEICGHKEAHNENLNTIENLNKTIPFSGMDVIHVKCIKYDRIKTTLSRECFNERFL